MTKMSAHSFKQPLELQDQLSQLEKKEKKTYEALAALIRFITGGKKQDAEKIRDFCQFKKAVLTSVASLEICRSKIAGEPKFNVRHYERAILCASDATYRDMAIQAAYQDLSKDAVQELIVALRKHCCKISRQVKELAESVTSMII